MHYKMFQLGLALMICPVLAWAGLSSSDYDSQTLKHEVEGELEVKPDRALYPLRITVDTRSYDNSLNKIESLHKTLETQVKALGESFNVSPAAFYKPGTYRKKSKLSFFSSDSASTSIRFVSYINVNFKQEHDFWTRARLIAKALDFIESFRKKNKSKTVSINHDDVVYEIDFIEQYRKKLIESIYKKAKNTAEIVAKQENASLQIKYVSFAQHIKKQSVSFNQTILTIPAVIEYSFK